jgi:hypothetical protein
LFEFESVEDHACVGETKKSASQYSTPDRLLEKRIKGEALFLSFFLLSFAVIILRQHPRDDHFCILGHLTPT